MKSSRSPSLPGAPAGTLPAVRELGPPDSEGGSGWATGVESHHEHALGGVGGYGSGTPRVVRSRGPGLGRGRRYGGQLDVRLSGRDLHGATHGRGRTRRRRSAGPGLDGSPARRHGPRRPDHHPARRRFRCRDAHARLRLALPPHLRHDGRREPPGGGGRGPRRPGPTPLRCRADQEVPARRLGQAAPSRPSSCSTCSATRRSCTS